MKNQSGKSNSICWQRTFSASTQSILPDESLSRRLQINWSACQASSGVNQARMKRSHMSRWLSSPKEGLCYASELVDDGCMHWKVNSEQYEAVRHLLTEDRTSVYPFIQAVECFKETSCSSPASASNRVRLLIDPNETQQQASASDKQIVFCTAAWRSCISELLSV